MKENVHEKHRERMRDRFIQNGADNLAPHELLEMILYYTMPRCDTNPIAHRLIETFGSFSGVLEASVEDLAEVKGVGKRTAVFLKLFLDVNRIYKIDKTANIKNLSTLEEIGEFIKPRFIGRRNEIVMMICLDSKNNIISTQILFEGSINSATLDIRRMVAIAIRQNAASIILAHNHPGGSPVPSLKDHETTKRLNIIFNSLSINLIDHLIFAGNEYISMVQSEKEKQQTSDIGHYISFKNEPEEIMAKKITTD